MERIIIRQELTGRHEPIKAEDQQNTEKSKQEVSPETIWGWPVCISLFALILGFCVAEPVSSAIADRVLELSKIKQEFNESHANRLALLEKLRDLVKERVILNAVAMDRFGTKSPKPTAELLAKKRWALKVSGYLAVEKALMSCNASRQQLATRRINQ